MACYRQWIPIMSFQDLLFLALCRRCANSNSQCSLQFELAGTVSANPKRPVTV